MSATQHGSSTLPLAMRSCSLSCRWRHGAWCGSWCPRHPRASCIPIDRTHESQACSLILIYQRWLFPMTQTFRNRRKVFAKSCFCSSFRLSSVIIAVLHNFPVFSGPPKLHSIFPMKISIFLIWAEVKILGKTLKPYKTKFTGMLTGMGFLS